MKQAVVELTMTMAVRGGAALGSVLLSLIVAHIAGAEGLGRFAVFLSLLGALAILARYGKDMLMIRAVAWANDKASTGTTIALLRLGGIQVLLPAFLLGGLGSVLLASGWLGIPFPGTLLLMPLALPLLTVLALVAGYTKGLKRPWLAPVFEMGGVSLLASIFIALIALNAPSIDESVIPLAFFLALLVPLCLAGIMILYDMPGSHKLPVLDQDQKMELRVGQVDFTLISLAAFLTQAGSLVLAAPFLSEADLGGLRAAERLALMVSFPVLAINPVISPRIVRLSRAGDPEGLRRLSFRAVFITSAFAAFILLPLLIFPEQTLALMGREFTSAAPYLRTMALANFLAAVTGPLLMLMNMSGKERASMWINLGLLVFASIVIPLMVFFHGAWGFVLSYCAIIGLRFFLTIFSVMVFSKLLSYKF